MLTKNQRGFLTLVWREIYRFLTVFRQTIFPPLVSCFLYMFVFGKSLGAQISAIDGIPYLEFLVPGLMMMTVIEGSYTNTSSSLFISRWANNIEELLVTPLSYFEMVTAMMLGGLVRSFSTALGVYAVSHFFVHTPIAHPLTAFFFMVTVSLIFSSLGMIVALFAEEFEHLALATTFIITPLVFFGGVFHSAKMVPAALQAYMAWNPMLYMINGIRFAMLGHADVSVTHCASVVAGLFVSLFSMTVYLFKIGFKLRK